MSKGREVRIAVVRRTLVGVACLVLAVTVAAPVLASPEERRLEQARERLDGVRVELERAREARDADERALEVAKARVEDVLAAVGEAELAVERQEQAVAAAASELDRLTDEVREREQRTADRAAELFRAGGTRSLKSVLAADSPGELMARSSLLDVVNRNDRRIFEGSVAARRAMGAQAERVDEERAALQRVLAQQEELLAEVEQLREDRAIALAESEQEVSRLVSHESYVAAETRQLAAIAQRAAEPPREQRSTRPSRSAPAAAAQPAASGGGWQWPASGRITSEYGMRWGRLHAGIDIASSHGSPISAARGGTVSHAGWLGGYGNLVTIDHGGGVVSAYAHLTSIGVGVGQPVSAGQRIGAMGCTGSCTGTHLHFEVRINGNPRNPRGYLP